MEPLNKQNDDYKYPQQNPNYKGEPLDPKFAQGPNQQRGCTDIFCCILYLAFWVGSIIIAIIAFTKGDPEYLSAPFNSSGFQCGFDQGFEQFPYIYYDANNPNIFSCINKCPSNAGQVSSLQCNQNSTTFSCVQYGAYPTSKILGVCFPINQTFTSSINIQIGFMEKNIVDLKNTWPISLCVVFFALILSFILLVLIRACGSILVWGTILIYFLALTIFGLICFLNANKIGDIPSLPLKNQTDLKTIAYVCWGVDILSLLVFICIFRKIKIGIAIIKASSDFTRQQCQTILVPLIMFISISLFFTLWFFVSIYLYSAGTTPSSCNSPYGCIDWDKNIQSLLIYYFIGLFWNCQVAIALCQFVIASTASYWYFSHLNKNQLHNPVTKSFARAFLYHFGSLAYGALVLCVLWVIQIILSFFHWMVKQKTMSSNPVQNCCLKCCFDCASCCVSCFQRFIRFISKNAFIMMGITGQGFCKSAHHAFYLIMRSKSQYAITNGIADIIMFFTKILITTLCTFFGYLMIIHIEQFDSHIFSPFMPTLMFAVISFVISSLFMDVFGIGAQTILLCYSIELDINKVAKSCPPALKQYFDENL